MNKVFKKASFVENASFNR